MKFLGPSFFLWKLIRKDRLWDGCSGWFCGCCLLAGVLGSGERIDRWMGERVAYEFVSGREARMRILGHLSD